MAYQHELLYTTEAIQYIADKEGLSHSAAIAYVITKMNDIADKICELKGWTVGLNCMVVVRSCQQSSGDKPNIWFVINQVLDTQKKAISVSDLNKNTPSLNADPHCILTTSKNGPNRYGGFQKLLETVSTDFTCNKNNETFKRIV